MSIATTRDKRAQIVADLAAERHLLGVALVDLPALDRFPLKERHFYSRAHRELWLAIDAAGGGNGPTRAVEVDDVIAELRRRGTDVTVHARSPAVLIREILFAPTLAIEHAETYALVVVECWRARKLTHALDHADSRLRLGHAFGEVWAELDATRRDLESAAVWGVARKPWLSSTVAA